MKRFTVETRDDDFSRHLGETIRRRCLELGMHWDLENPELVICIGGDGTILRAIHKYLYRIDETEFTGIHTGTLGFLTDYTKDEIQIFLRDLERGPVRTDESVLLEIRIPSKSDPLYALNEVRIESFNRTLSFDIFIDEEFFERCTGSGICISTQAGSTAINRALSGAVIDSGLNVLQLTEIMPVTHKGHHSLRNPYIMNTDRKILLKGKDLQDARACYDHLEFPLEDTDHLEICASRHKVRFVRYRDYSYLKRLKSLY